MFESKYCASKVKMDSPLRVDTDRSNWLFTLGLIVLESSALEKLEKV